MEENIRSCACGERPEVDLQTDARPLVVLTDEECDCGCDEVELCTDHQPDIILFEEWADEHVDDIVQAKEAAEEARDLVRVKSEIIEGKTDLIIDNTATIKRDLSRDTENIRADISDSKRTLVKGIDDIRGDIADVREGMTLEECTEEEVYAMFPNEESETE